MTDRTPTGHVMRASAVIGAFVPPATPSLPAPAPPVSRAPWTRGTEQRAAGVVAGGVGETGESAPQAGGDERTEGEDGRRSQATHDQASGLRLLAARRRAYDPAQRLGQTTRVLAVASGKGGVGKTSVVVNVGVALARLGKRVIVLDCDLGTANVDVMLGLHPRYSLQHVLSRQRRLDEVLVAGPAGLRIIPGGSGLHELANLSEARREELLATFATLDGQADVLLIDTGAGISANVLRFVVAAGEALVITTPEPTAVTDAYALIKVASQQAGAARDGWRPGGPGGGEASHVALAEKNEASRHGLRLCLVVNQAATEAEARETGQNIATVARRFLNVLVEPFGTIPADAHVGRAVRAQVPVVEAFPRSPAALALDRLARRIAAESAAPEPRAPAGGAGRRDGFAGLLQRMLSLGKTRERN